MDFKVEKEVLRESWMRVVKKVRSGEGTGKVLKVGLISVFVFFVYGISIALAQKLTSTPGGSLSEFWSHQFGKNESVDAVAFKADDSGKPQYVLVKSTQEITDKPDSYYETHPRRQQKISILSFQDGQKISEKTYLFQGEGKVVTLSPNGDVWFCSSQWGGKPPVMGYIEKSNGTQINLDLSQSSACDEIDISPTGALALLSGGGWTLRNGNGTVLQSDAKSDLVDNQVYFSDDEKLIAFGTAKSKLINFTLLNNLGNKLFEYPVGKESIRSCVFSKDDSLIAFTTSEKLYVVDLNGNLVFEKNYHYAAVREFLNNNQALMRDYQKPWIVDFNGDEKPFKDTSDGKASWAVKGYPKGEILLKHNSPNKQTPQQEDAIEVSDSSGETLGQLKVNFILKGNYLFQNKYLTVWGTNEANTVLKVFKLVK